MIWFTSDTHFGHENVLKFTDRPWETIQQMNSARSTGDSTSRRGSSDTTTTTSGATAGTG